MANRYSRTNLIGIVYPTEGDLTPYLEVVDGRYVRFLKELKFERSFIVTDSAAGRLEFISYQLYKTIDLWWVIGLYNGIVNPFKEVIAGKLLRVPTRASIDNFFKTIEASKQSTSRITVLS